MWTGSSKLRGPSPTGATLNSSRWKKTYEIKYGSYNLLHCDILKNSAKMHAIGF
jgi:hypothetical protein